jgi:type I restriction enzyme M protein
MVVHLDAYVTVHRQQIIMALENWWNKYAVSLPRIEAERVAASAKFTGFLKDLGYE